MLLNKTVILTNTNPEKRTRALLFRYFWSRMNEDEPYFTQETEDSWNRECGRMRIQKMNKGHSNLSSHITIDHPCWRDGFKKFQKQSSMEISFTSQKGHDIYRW